MGTTDQDAMGLKNEFALPSRMETILDYKIENQILLIPFRSCASV